MQKYFKIAGLVATLLCVIFMLAACGGDETSQSDVNSSNAALQGQSASSASPSEASEQQEEVVISVHMPDGWDPVKGSVLPVQYMKNTASFMVKEEHFTSDTLNEVVNEALKIYEKSFDNLAVQGDVESVTIDDEEAKKLTFTCTVSDMSMKYLYVYLFAEGKTYVITFGDLADCFDALSEDYETILSEIKFE